MSYEPLTKEPAALMDDRVQEAAIESINRNFSADTLDDTVYFANARMIAEEQDRVQRAQAERMAAAAPEDEQRGIYRPRKPDCLQRQHVHRKSVGGREGLRSCEEARVQPPELGDGE